MPPKTANSFKMDSKGMDGREIKTHMVELYEMIKEERNKDTW